MNTEKTQTVQSSNTRRQLLSFIPGAVAGISLASTSALADEPEASWTFETDSTVVSSPTVADRRVVVGSGGGGEEDRTGTVHALDISTGRPDAEFGWEFEAGDNVRSSPTIVDGIIFVGSDDGNLYALDLETGEEIWRFETDAEITSSPTVFDGRVYIANQDREGYVLDASTGRIDSSFQPSRYTDKEYQFRGRNSPVITSDTLFMCGGRSTLFAYDAVTGERQWRFDTDEALRTSPTVYGQTVLVGNTERLFAIDTETGAERWHHDGAPEHSQRGQVGVALTAHNGTVFETRGAVEDGGGIYAFDIESGDLQWRFAPDDERSIFTSPTVSDGIVYTGSVQWGLVYAIDASTGEMLWQSSPLSNTMSSSPTIADGTLYIGSHDGVHAIEEQVSDSSSGSRARLGTLGHHEEWAGKDEAVLLDNKDENTVDNEDPVGEVGTTDDGVPGFGIGGAVTAIGGTAYLLKRRLVETETDSA